MNMFQRINITASLAVVGTVGVAYFKAISEIDKNTSLLNVSVEHVDPLVLTLFILLFKIKTMFDDHQHFGEERQKKGGFRHAGILFALFSWFFWILAGYFVFIPERAAELMIISILVSTGWIAVHIIELIAEGKRGSELSVALMREKWVLFNVFYILCLGVYVGWISPVVEPFSLTPLLILFALLIFDYMSSRSYPEDNIE